MIDFCVALRCLDDHDRAAISRCLIRSIQAGLKADRKQRVMIAGSTVESFLAADPPQLQEAWNVLKGWYREAGNRTPPPLRSTLEKVTEERKALYRKEEPPGEPIPIMVKPVE
eukprot:scaffold193952_cov24-Attheya_sp.AAC.1